MRHNKYFYAGKYTKSCFCFARVMNLKLPSYHICEINFLNSCGFARALAHPLPCSQLEPFPAPCVCKPEVVIFIDHLQTMNAEHYSNLHRGLHQKLMKKVSGDVLMRDFARHRAIHRTITARHFSILLIPRRLSFFDEVFSDDKFSRGIKMRDDILSAPAQSRSERSFFNMSLCQKCAPTLLLQIEFKLRNKNKLPAAAIL